MPNRKIKYFLVFFCAITWIGCTEKKPIEDIEVRYKNTQAVSVVFPNKDIEDYDVFLKANDISPVLGTFHHEHGNTTFTPVIPFSKGEVYEIRHCGNLHGHFTIDRNEQSPRPELVAIYPSIDTLPQNILKLYLEFSEPMQHVKSALDFIQIHDNSVDREVNVFLELESELWNEEHNRLTLWFDPGRIKTDLIPNKKKGPPLLTGHEYTIGISSKWQSAAGIPLQKTYTKHFHVIEKDIQRPNPELWHLTIPERNTFNQMQIDFNESMDAILALETIKIHNDRGEKVSGMFNLADNEHKLLFEPTKKWEKGKYHLLIDPVLEDLAGNNLERLFDTDLSKSDPVENLSKNLVFYIK